MLKKGPGQQSWSSVRLCGPGEHIFRDSVFPDFFLFQVKPHDLYSLVADVPKYFHNPAIDLASHSLTFLKKSPAHSIRVYLLAE